MRRPGTTHANALFQLTALEDPSSAKVEAIELLTLLVERHEQAHYAIPEADAISVLRFLIEQQGLTQRDLTPEFGSESAASMFLAGQRKLTLEQVRNLSSRFIVQHHMDGKIGTNGTIDLIQEFAELDSAMAWPTPADHRSGGDVQGRE